MGVLFLLIFFEEINLFFVMLRWFILCWFVSDIIFWVFVFGFVICGKSYFGRRGFLVFF